MANAVCVLDSSDTETGRENDMSILYFCLFLEKKIITLDWPIVTDKYVKNENGFSIFTILKIEVFTCHKIACLNPHQKSAQIICISQKRNLVSKNLCKP